MGLCQSKDMAICLVIFNPTKSKKIIQNYFTMIKELKKFPVFTLELVYEGNQPEIKDAFHIYGKSVMFHKENLCRILETKIPYKYKKLAFLDTDVLFNDFYWYAKTSKLLDSCDIVQLFDKCHWLNTNGDITLTRQSVLHMDSKVYDSKYHPGFAWAFRREWYNKAGFFDYALSGSGDALSVIKWMNKLLPKNYKSLPKSIQKEYAKYPDILPRITYLENVEILHLYHGSRKNRQYVDRHEMLNINMDIKDMINVKNGLYEWKDPKMNKQFMDYFISRKDDEDEDEVILIKVVDETS
jgi:hypothetical protein